MASQHEHHPESGMNGSFQLDFFKREFGFGARETVAIMGAHTIGRAALAKNQSGA